MDIESIVKKRLDSRTEELKRQDETRLRLIKEEEDKKRDLILSYDPSGNFKLTYSDTRLIDLILKRVKYKDGHSIFIQLYELEDGQVMRKFITYFEEYRKHIQYAEHDRSAEYGEFAVSFDPSKPKFGTNIRLESIKPVFEKTERERIACVSKYDPTDSLKLDQLDVKYIDVILNCIKTKDIVTNSDLDLGYPYVKPRDYTYQKPIAYLRKHGIIIRKYSRSLPKKIAHFFMYTHNHPYTVFTISYDPLVYVNQTPRPKNEYQKLAQNSVSNHED